MLARVTVNREPDAVDTSATSSRFTNACNSVSDRNSPAPAMYSHLMFQELVKMSDRQTGTVKWFNDAKGFGFITPQSGPDLFPKTGRCLWTDLLRDDPIYQLVDGGP